MLANNPMIPAWQRRAYSGQSDPILIKDRTNQPVERKKPAIIGVQFMGDLWHKNIDWVMIDQVFESCLKAPQHTYIFLTKRIEAAWHYFNSPVHPEEISGKHRSEYLLKNIWLGITAENQKRADERIPVLLQIPAKVRFVSIEPALEYVYIERYLPNHPNDIPFRLDFLNWVIWGPETGIGKRPFNPDWAKRTHSLCKEREISFFDKTKKNWIAREFPKPC